MFALVGHPEIKSDEVSWCAAAVGAWLHAAGLKGTGSLMARSYMRYGRTLDIHKKLPRGAILVFAFGRAPHGHVTLLLDDRGDTLRCLGGNQRDAVTEATYGRAKLIAAVWPHDDAAPALAAEPDEPKEEEKPEEAPEPCPAKPKSALKRFWGWLTGGGLAAAGGLGIFSGAGDVVDGWPWQATVGVAFVIAAAGVVLDQEVEVALKPIQAADLDLKANPIPPTALAALVTHGLLQQ